MSQHFRSLFQQITPLLYNTPFSATKKQDDKIEIALTSSKKSSRRELKYSSKDSGLDTSSSSCKKIRLNRTSTKNQLNQITMCKSCTQNFDQKIQIRKKLKKSYQTYINSNLNESHFANIPLIVSKSFRPKSENINKILVKKGSAVNALYMIDNKWIYVKTINEKCGFIPARCCQPFDVTSKCKHVRSVPKMKIPDLPCGKISSDQEHTYISVDQNMYEKLSNCKSEDKNEYGLLVDAESNPVHQYDCLMNYTPKVHKKKIEEKNYYNSLSSETKNLCLYKVRKDYRSNFNGGLSVSKGDLVYMIDTNLSLDLQVLNTQNLVFVRVYRRFSSQLYENLNGVETNMLQGFIPKANLIKLNDSNLNSPIYC